MKNVLFLLDYYIPNASANGICVNKVVQELLENKINVSIICYEDTINKALNSNEDKSKKEKIYYLPHSPQKKRFHSIVFYLKWIFERKRLPFENKKVSEDMLRLVEEVVVKEKIDTVVCTYLPIETITVGKKLKEKYPSLNIVAYMLDSLSGGFVPRLLPESFCRKKKIIWENKTLSCFDQVILMEASKKHHEKYSKMEKWYQRAYFLDIPALSKNNNYTHKSQNKNGEIVISFVGTMCPGVRTPYALLKVLAGIKDIKIRFIIAGKNNCGDLSDYVKGNENIILDIRGEIPYDEAQQIIGNSDYLVNFGNVNTNLVPSKIFEYMSYGKPIISTYTCDEDSSLPYLYKYPLVYSIYEGKEDFTKTSEELKDFIEKNKNIRVPYEKIAQSFYKNTPTALYSLLFLSHKGEE